MITLLCLLGLAGASWSLPLKDGSHMTAHAGGKPLDLLYSNNFNKLAVSTVFNIEQWYMHRPYSICPPTSGGGRQQRWWFKAFDSQEFRILISAENGRMLRFMPNATLDSKNCLLIYNLTAEWYGTFQYDVDYRIMGSWSFKAPKGHLRSSSPALVFTPVVTPPTHMVKLCPSLEDSITRAQSLRWHFIDKDQKLQEFAFRRDTSYYWVGYRYSQYTAQNIFRWGFMATFYTDGCVKVLLSEDRYVILTVASDAAGNKNLRRYVWRGYPNEAEKPLHYPKLGILGAVENPNRFHDKGPLDYWYVKGGNHFSYFDPSTPWQHKNQSWEKGKTLRMCTTVPREYGRAQWSFLPWWSALDYSHANIVATRLDLNFQDTRSNMHTDLISSPGIQISADGRCLTVSNMDNDIAGKWVHFFNKRWYPTTVFHVDPTPEAKPPADSYRQTVVNFGQKNVWICPRRDGQLSWTEVKITMRDPVDGFGQVLFHRNVDWKTQSVIESLNPYMEYSSLSKYVKHMDKTSCVVVNEVNWETLASYEIEYTFVKGLKWKEVVEFVLKKDVPIEPRLELTSTSAPIASTTILQATAELTTPPPPSGTLETLIRSKRALCDGCHSLTWGQNTKYVFLGHTVNVQGLNRDPECALTWVTPTGMPLVTHQNNTIFWVPQRDESWHSFNYAVSYDDGALTIREFSKKEEGLWAGFQSCPNREHSKVFLTKLFLANSIQHLTAPIFEEFTFPAAYQPADTVRITLNGQKPACLSERRCEYHPETGELTLDAFLSADVGIWVVNHTRHGTPAHVQVFTLAAQTPAGCLTVEPSSIGLLSLAIPDEKFDRPIKIFWFKVENEETGTLTPISMVEGGHTKEVYDKTTFPFFNGNLRLPHNKCGLYLAFIYSPDNHRFPTELRMFRYICNPEKDKTLDPFYCAPIKQFSDIGTMVESPYPTNNIVNHTLFVMWQPPYQSGLKTLCYARDGHTLWDSPRSTNITCFFDGSYVLNRRFECGFHQVLGFDHEHMNERSAQLSRNLLHCRKPIRTRRSAEGQSKEAEVGIVEDSEPFAVTLNVEYSFLLNTTGEALVRKLEQMFNMTIAHPTPDALEGPPVVIFPINNINSGNTLIIVSSLLILCLFFALWLVCKWKKQRRELARAAANAPPIYTELEKLYPEK